MGASPSQTNPKDFITQREIRTYSHVKRRQQTMMMDAIAKIVVLSKEGEKNVTPEGRELVEKIQEIQTKLLEFQHEKRIKAKNIIADEKNFESVAGLLVKGLATTETIPT